MIYELRQYTIADGMRDELHELFERSIGPLFEEVGMRTIAYWEPVAGTPSGDVDFVYLLGFEDARKRATACGKPSWSIRNGWRCATGWATPSRGRRWKS